MKKMLVRIIAMTLVMVLGLSIFSTAFAASKSYKGTGSTTYTITTGRKDVTLKVSQTAGKVSATAWKNALRKTTKTVPRNWYGKFKITVTCGFSSQSAIITYPADRTASFKLKKNSDYTVTVEYLGFSDQTGDAWNPKWKTSPKVKLSVNNSAKIK